MRIRGDKLKQLVKTSSVELGDLAAAVARTGLPEHKAVSAIRSWMRGSDHPRCKPCDIESLAGALGCPIPAIARFTCQVKHHRGAPRKARLVADLIRGRNVADAINLLWLNHKRAAVNIRKALDAAIADAELAGADTDSLVIAESRVDEGPTMKRFQPKDRGRAHSIMKRTSHITIGLDDRSAGRAS